MDDDTLINALKGADFLRDSATEAALSRALLLAMLDNQTSLSSPLSEAECARASRIAHAVPQQHLPAIFATIERKRGDSPFSSGPPSRRQPDSLTFQKLLRLLPPSFHPTILRACCSCNEEGTSISIPPVPPCMKLGAAHPASDNAAGGAAAAPVDLTADADRGHACSPDHTSALFQLLTLLAPAEPRRPQHVREPASAPSHEEISHKPVTSESRSNHSNGHIVRGFEEESAAMWLAATAGEDLQPAPWATSELLRSAGRDITRVELLFDDDGCQNIGGGTVYESPRWCTALPQLRTLRELSVTAPEPWRLSVEEFGAALQALPALQKLSIECMACTDEDFQCSSTQHVSLGRLMGAVAALKQLTALSLVNCFYLGTVLSPDEEHLMQETPLPEVALLSTLTRLTSLAVRAPLMDTTTSNVLVDAVKQMTALECLHVVVDTSDSAGHEHHSAAQMTLQLYAATELVALTSLTLPSTDWGDGGGRVIGGLLLRLRRENPALRTRLRALSVDRAIRGNCEEQVNAVQHLLVALPALRSLGLRYCQLRDDALLHIASISSRLTHLDIHGNRAGLAGITAVLEAAVAAAAAGAGGLRELDIGTNYVAVEAAAELAAVLRQLTSLEALNLRSVFDRPGGLQELMPALGALPRLRRVRLPETAGVLRPSGAGSFDAAAYLLTELGRVHMD